MKKNLLIVFILFVVHFNFLLSNNNSNIILGMTNSYYASSKVKDTDKSLGFKVGYQKTLNNGIIRGFSLTQRGFRVADYSEKINYATFYMAYPFRPFAIYKEYVPTIYLGFEGGLLLSRFQCENSSCDHISPKGNIELMVDTNGRYVDTGLVFAAEYELSAKWGVVGRYYHGLSAVIQKASIFNRNFQIYLSYKY